MVVPLLFFGAGASRPFGIPTMTEMVSKFEVHLKKENVKGRYLYERVKDLLSKEYDKSKIDIESIFSIIEGISKQITPKDMGYFPFYYMKRFSFQHPFSDSEIEDAISLKETLEKFVKNECSVKESNDKLSEIYEKSYDVLFNNLGINKKKNPNGLEYSYPWKAYSTNYDLIFENYWTELVSISDFFEMRGNQVATFDITKNLDSNSYVKLHGSINWEKLEDGDIIKSDPTSTFTRRKKQGAAMLYPIQQKDLYLHPWITLFQEFKKGLKESDVWYVIGYAFNDEFILNAFLESFKDSKQMILINPDSINIKSKFPKDKQELITALPIKFGDEFFRQDFEDYSYDRRTVEVEISTTAKIFGIYFPAKIDYMETLEFNNVQEHPETTHSNKGDSLEFFSDNFHNKTVKFKIIIHDFSKFDNTLEIKTHSRERGLVHVVLKNQGRMITAFTNQNQNADRTTESFYGSTNVDKTYFSNFNR